MGIFVISGLALFMTIFLLSIAVQAIHMEKGVSDTARYLEHKVTKLLHGEL
jgi:hypothetical protein